VLAVEVFNCSCFLLSVAAVASAVAAEIAVAVGLLFASLATYVLVAYFLG